MYYFITFILVVQHHSTSIGLGPPYSVSICVLNPPPVLSTYQKVSQYEEITFYVQHIICYMGQNCIQNKQILMSS